MDYSNQPKLLKLKQPILMFQMPVDSSSRRIPGINQGRLSLWDYEHGLIYRWVATSSHDGKQDWGDWEQRGGVHPPNFAMSGAEWFWLDLKLIIQPGQPVDEGYLPLYNGSNTWKTLKGNTRSQIMFHEDKPPIGSLGCIVMSKSEWESFKSVIKACCGDLDKIRYGVLYSS